ncbi:MAG: TIGR02996 domain-containing protein [Mariniblastus sp.]
MPNEHTSFLAEIASDPYSDLPRLIYADWLEEQQDIRGEYLRLEIEFADCKVFDRHHQGIFNRLIELMDPAVGIDLDWVEQAGTKFDYLIRRFGFRKLDAVKTVKFVTGGSLMDCKRLVEQPLPTHVVTCVSLPLLALRSIPNQFSAATRDDPFFLIQRHDQTAAPSELSNPTFYDVYLKTFGSSKAETIEWLRGGMVDLDSEKATELTDRLPAKIGLSIPLAATYMWQIDLEAHFGDRFGQVELPELEFRKVRNLD